MKVFAVAALMLMSGPGRAEPGATSSLPADFRVVIDHDQHRWTATCEEGCAWRTIIYGCASDCSVLLDAYGVKAGIEEPAEESAFAFLLSPTESGWAAVSVRGTAWTKLSWGCSRLRACEARVDESGVGPS